MRSPLATERRSWRPIWSAREVRPKHAAFLGLTVTVTHTAGVFALGLITLYLSHYILPETLYPWLSVVSGALVVAIGFSMAWRRWRGGGHDHAHDHSHAHDHDHEHTHDHDHDHDHENVQAHGTLTHTHDGHTHSHAIPGADGSPVTWRSLLALGVSGGLIPCPSALVLLLAAISLGRLGVRDDPGRGVQPGAGRAS